MFRDLIIHNALKQTLFTVALYNFGSFVPNSRKLILPLIRNFFVFTWSRGIEIQLQLHD